MLILGNTISVSCKPPEMNDSIKWIIATQRNSMITVPTLSKYRPTRTQYPSNISKWAVFKISGFNFRWCVHQILHRYFVLAFYDCLSKTQSNLFGSISIQVPGPCNVRYNHGNVSQWKFWCMREVIIDYKSDSFWQWNQLIFGQHSCKLWVRTNWWENLILIRA